MTYRYIINESRFKLVVVLILLSTFLVKDNTVYAQVCTKLNPQFPENGDVHIFGDFSTAYDISPDGRMVVYIADQDIDEVFGLYSVPITGGESVRLSAALIEAGDDLFQISPDGTMVVYIADQGTDGVYELFSVPIEGGVAPVILNDTLADEISVRSDFQISPNGGTVVYRANRDTDGVSELYSVHITGGESVKLNGALTENGEVRRFQITPDGNRVVYQADQVTDDIFELYSVPVEGGEDVKLNNTLPEGGNVATFTISNERVVYLLNINGPKIYSVHIGGGNVTEINTGTEIVLRPINISPGGRIVFRSVPNDPFELFSVPIEGGVTVRLNGALTENGEVGRFQITPDGSRVIYRADQDTNEVFELYSVPTGGGESVKLSGTLTDGGDVSDPFLINPEGSRIIYRADQDTNEVFELYSVPTGGGESVKLSGTLTDGGDVSDRFLISPDGSTVVYFADQDTDGVSELYSAAIVGGSAIKLNDTIRDFVRIDSYRISSAGRVVYVADQDTDEVYEIYSCSLPEAGDEQRVVTEFFSARALGETFRIEQSPQEGACAGFGAEFNVVIRFMNESDEEVISNLAIEVATLGGGREIGNADDQSVRGEGARLTVEERGEGYSDGELGPGESAVANFVFCLPNLNRFTMYVDVLGLPSRGESTP